MSSVSTRRVRPTPGYTAMSAAQYLSDRLATPSMRVAITPAAVLFSYADEAGVSGRRPARRQFSHPWRAELRSRNRRDGGMYGLEGPL
jgi:hypothetical protein